MLISLGNIRHEKVLFVYLYSKSIHLSFPLLDSSFEFQLSEFETRLFSCYIIMTLDAKILGQNLYKYILVASLASVLRGQEDKFILFERRLEKRYENRDS